MKTFIFLVSSFFAFELMAHATPFSYPKCPHMTVFDYSSYMCMPYAMEGMPMKMFMVNGNIYGGQTVSEPSRGQSAIWSTSMIMADLGTNVGANHYLNVDLMVTGERFTLPKSGYPLLFQIGESTSEGVPYRDAQHPHSSPIMGITVSDTVNLSNPGDYLKVFFSPRGESTDGPVAFMHRPTGMANPDAPLGHHVGQDVGHISSTVIGASVKVGETRFEASTFYGQEPKPESIDLPLGVPNSYAVRLIREFSPHFTAMISGAYIKDPESTGNPNAFVSRYSVSFYRSDLWPKQWMFQGALLGGLTQKYDHAEVLASVGEEFLFQKNRDRIFGRLEILQRTPESLGIDSLFPDQGLWLSALTLGYSNRILDVERDELLGQGFGMYLGVSLTHGFLPEEFRPSYGGDPWSGKIFLQFGGMKMTHF